MAKKKASRTEFNMAAEIRALLTKDPKMTGRQVVEGLTAKFPGRRINENSCSVAYSTARRQLGIVSSRKKAVRRRKPGRNGQVLPGMSLTALQAARKLIAEVGGAEVAMSAIRQVESLQIR
jgi:hypothetical protein